MMERNDKGHLVRRYFIDMERKALAAAHPPPALPLDTITPEHQNALQQIVKRRAQETGTILAYFWSSFNNHFKLGSYKQLPASRFAEAVDYLEEMPVKRNTKVMNGLNDGMDTRLQPVLDHVLNARFMLSFRNGCAVLTEVERDACVVSPTKQAEMETLMREFVPNEMLGPMMQIGMNRLTRIAKSKT